MKPAKVDVPMVMVVQFTGVPGVRVISPEDWAAAGVPDHAEVRWDQLNNWSVRVDELRLSDEDLRRCILADPGFLLRPEEVS